MAKEEYAALRIKYEALAVGWKKLGAVVAKTHKLIKDKYAEYRKGMKQTEGWSMAVKKRMLKRQESYTSRYAQLIRTRLVKPMKWWQKGLKKTGAVAQVALARMAKFFHPLMLSIGAITATVTAFAAAIAATGIAAALFQKRMLMVSTMLGDHQHLLRGMADTVQDMSMAFGQSTETIARGLYDILSAQIDTSQALDVLRVSAIGATAGFVDLAVANDALITMLRSFKKPVAEAADMMDLLFSIVRMGRTTFAELAPVLGYSAATMGIAGVSAEEYGAALAALTQAGMRTRTVSITLNAIVRGFLRPSKRSADLARKWGLALSATTLRAQGLTGVIRHLSEQTAAWGDRTADILGQIFPQIRGFRGIAAAIQNVDKYMDALNAMYDRGGEAMKAYSRAARGIMFNLNRIKAAIPMLLANIFDLGVGVNRAGSVLKLVADKLSAFVSALRDTSSVAHRAARDFLTFAKAIGIAVVVIAGLFVLGSLVGIIGSLIAVAAPLIGVATTILALFGSLFTAGSLFAGAVALVKGEIGDLTKALGSNLDVMRKGHKENLELIRELQRIRDLKTKGVTVTESLITVVEKLQRAYPGLAAGVDLAKVSLEDLNKILLESIKNARLGAQTIRTEARLAFEIAEVALKDYIGRLKDLAKDERKLEQERARRYRKRGVSWEEANYAQRARRARIEKALNSISKEREQILKKLARASREYGNAIKYDSVKALLAERDANEALALWLKSSLRIRKKSTKAMVVLSDDLADSIMATAREIKRADMNEWQKQIDTAKEKARERHEILTRWANQTWEDVKMDLEASRELRIKYYGYFLRIVEAFYNEVADAQDKAKDKEEKDLMDRASLWERIYKALGMKTAAAWMKVSKEVRKIQQEMITAGLPEKLIQEVSRAMYDTFRKGIKKIGKIALKMAPMDIAATTAKFGPMGISPRLAATLTRGKQIEEKILTVNERMDKRWADAIRDGFKVRGLGWIGPVR